MVEADEVLYLEWFVNMSQNNLIVLAVKEFHGRTVLSPPYGMDPGNG